MSKFLLYLGLILYFIGFWQLMKRPKKPFPNMMDSLRSPTGGRKPAPARMARTASARMDGRLNVKPVNLDWIKVGGRIEVVHQSLGPIPVAILGRITFQELWQKSSGSRSPWVPTGDIYAGFWLESDLYLLNWQNRYYLLDVQTLVSDVEIKQQFMPYARQFGQSGQDADVSFSYPPAVWRIDDIGRFTVHSVEGRGFNQRVGAEGRFIHASGDSGRGLVLEDYRGGGGGRDTVWTGYWIDKEDIKNI